MAQCFDQRTGLRDRRTQVRVAHQGRRRAEAVGVASGRRSAVRISRPAHGERVHFENVVFAGGGNRCFWQAGFWSVAAPRLALRPARVAAVSAGAAVACALLAQTFFTAFRQYMNSLSANDSNVHLRNLLRNRPLFPHGSMYRDAILASINERALLRLHRGPDIRILVARPPRWAPPRVALLLGMIASTVDDWRRECVHDSAACRIGFRPQLFSVRECATPESLADLIIASSCLPPLTPQARHNGDALFDGGFVSNVPALGVGEGRGPTLILLSRQFARLPSISGRTYVQPSSPIPAAAWDYTDAAAVQATFDLGRRDGERFCAGLGVSA